MSRVQRLVIVLALNLALVASLVIVGVTAHSLAVRREGRLSPTNVAALVNAGWLLALEVLVAGAAIGRLVTGAPEVDGLPVLIVSAVAALAMAAGALILRGDDDDGDDGAPGDRDASVAAVLLDTVADAAAAAGVAVTGAIILATGGWYWLDPAVALVIAVIVAYHALALIRQVVAAPGGAGGSGPAKINRPAGTLQSDGDQRGSAAGAGAARARHRTPRGFQRRRVRHRHHPAGADRRGHRVPGHRAVLHHPVQAADHRDPPQAAPVTGGVAAAAHDPRVGVMTPRWQRLRMSGLAERPRTGVSPSPAPGGGLPCQWGGNPWVRDARGDARPRRPDSTGRSWSALPGWHGRTSP